MRISSAASVPAFARKPTQYNTMIGTYKVRISVVDSDKDSVRFIAHCINLPSWYINVDLSDAFKVKVTHLNKSCERIANPLVNLSREYGKLDSFCYTIGLGIVNKLRAKKGAA